MKEAEAHGVIRRLHEWILEPQAWQSSLPALTRASGSQHGSTMIYDTAPDQPAFGIVAFGDTRRKLFGNPAGERWARRLDPAARSASWRLAQLPGHMIRAACRPDSPVPAQAAPTRSSNGAQAPVIVMPRAGEKSGIRLESGCTQRKAIFHKAGIGTQAQLAYRLAQLAAVLPPI